MTNLEDAIERWTAATGHTFSPIVRYRTNHYVDHTSPDAHVHDARISLTREGSPRIELMEVTGEGTHGATELGIHHFGFAGVVDPEAKVEELAEIGIDADGISYNEKGQIHLWFTDKARLDGIRLEYVSTLVSPLVDDDGSELYTNPETGRPSIWGPPAEKA